MRFTVKITERAGIQNLKKGPLSDTELHAIDGIRSSTVRIEAKDAEDAQYKAGEWYRTAWADSRISIDSVVKSEE